jgi:hypothetical protein
VSEGDERKVDEATLALLSSEIRFNCSRSLPSLIRCSELLKLRYRCGGWEISEHRPRSFFIVANSIDSSAVFVQLTAPATRLLQPRLRPARADDNNFDSSQFRVQAKVFLVSAPFCYSVKLLALAFSFETRNFAKLNKAELAGSSHESLSCLIGLELERRGMLASRLR